MDPFKSVDDATAAAGGENGGTGLEGQVSPEVPAAFRTSRTLNISGRAVDLQTQPSGFALCTGRCWLEAERRRGEEAKYQTRTKHQAIRIQEPLESAPSSMSIISSSKTKVKQTVRATQIRPLGTDLSEQGAGGRTSQRVQEEVMRIKQITSAWFT